MSFLGYELDEGVAVLSMNNGENRFNPAFLKEFLEILDDIELKTDAKVLVVKSSHDKIFCNGIDLDWFMPVHQAGDSAAIRDFCYTLNRLLRRILLYPMPTVAAITGHAFAGGAIFACTFDFRFMRSDRGFFCFPEVDLGIPFWPGMVAIVKKAIPQYKLDELYYLGMRISGKECEEHRIVVKACPSDELMPAVMQFAKGIHKDRKFYLAQKERMNHTIVKIMDEEDPIVLDKARIHA